VTETSTAGRLIANRDGGSRAEPPVRKSFQSRKLNPSNGNKRAGQPFRYRGCMLQKHATSAQHGWEAGWYREFRLVPV